MSEKTSLKAYFRIDGNGRMVPSSLILRKRKPKVGNWIEVPADECCEPVYTTTTTTTTLPPCYLFELNVIGLASYSGIDCDGAAISGDPKTGIFTRCARSLEGVGDIIVTNLGPCI